MMRRSNIMVLILCAAAVLLAAHPGFSQPAAPRAQPRPWEGPAFRPGIQSAADGRLGLGCTGLYCLRQATLNGAGQPAATASSDYALNASMGQEFATGCSSSFHFVVQSGFWGWAGSTLVPVVLLVTKDPAEPAWPKLDWTGNNAPYSVYRATTCPLIFDGYYAGTGGKTYTDEAPPAAALTCYNILATAPGRSAERFSPDPNGSVLMVGPAY